MLTQNKTQARRALGSSLGFVFIITIVPVILTSTMGMTVPYEFLVAGTYLTAMLLLVLSLAPHCKFPTPSWVLLGAMYGITQGFTLVVGTISYGNFHPMDLVSAIAKVIGVIVFAGMGSSLILRHSELTRFLKIILVLTIMALVYNVVINGSSFSSIFASNDSSYSIVFSSFFANRNQFGQFLFLSLFAHFLYVNQTRLGIANYIIFATQFISLFLTLSRGSIAAAMVMVVVLVLGKLRKSAFQVFGFGLVVMTCFAALLKSRWGEDIIRLVFRPEVGLSGRDIAWNYGLEVWQDTSFLFGAGGFSGVQDAQSRGMGLTEFHSLFIEMLVSGGVIELLLVISIIFFAAYKILRSGLERSTRFVFLSGYAGLIVLCVIESISFFTIGFVGTAFSIFFVFLPVSLSNGLIQDDRSNTISLNA